MRLSIARAVYARADIVLLDAPFSALDSHVGEHILHRCILGLLRSMCTTVVLVTHHVAAARWADQVVVMSTAARIDDGAAARDSELPVACIAEQGTFDELMARPNGLLVEMMTHHADADTRTQQQHEASAAVHAAAPALMLHPPPPPLPPTIASSLSHDDSLEFQMHTDGSLYFDVPHAWAAAAKTGTGGGSSLINDSLSMNALGIVESAQPLPPSLQSSSALTTARAPEPAVASQGELVVKERHFKGANTIDTYIQYLRACGLLAIALILCLALGARVIDVCTDLWLSIWASNAKANANAAVSPIAAAAASVFGALIPPSTQDHAELAYLNVYAGFALASIITLMAVSAYAIQVCIFLSCSSFMKAQILFDSIIHALVCSMAFCRSA